MSKRCFLFAYIFFPTQCRCDCSSLDIPGPSDSGFRSLNTACVRKRYTRLAIHILNEVILYIVYVTRVAAVSASSSDDRRIVLLRNAVDMWKNWFSKCTFLRKQYKYTCTATEYLGYAENIHEKKKQSINILHAKSLVRQNQIHIYYYTYMYMCVLLSASPRVRYTTARVTTFAAHLNNYDVKISYTTFLHREIILLLSLSNNLCCN